MRETYPNGVTKADIDEAIKEFERDRDSHGFGPSVGYDLVLPDGRRFPPKAIAGIATRRVLGRAMKPDEFSGGEGQACSRVLRKHGFKIEPKQGAQAMPELSDGWSDDELRATVGAYLDMLALEQAGTAYNKAEYNRQLRAGTLAARTRPAVERRMANISGALRDLGLPWINGYKPLAHVGDNVKQRLLRLLAESQAGFAIISRPAVEEFEVQQRTCALLRGKPLSKPMGTAHPVAVDRSAKRYERSPEVQAYVRQQAAGSCELCQEPAPFVDSDGIPFLEVHHVVPLADGGPDTVENTAALCPNCHRCLHHSGDRDQKLAQLYASVGRLQRPPQPGKHGV